MSCFSFLVGRITSHATSSFPVVLPALHAASSFPVVPPALHASCSLRRWRFVSYCLIFALLAFFYGSKIATAQSGGNYSMQEVIDSGHRFFGSTSGGLATAIEHIFQRYGSPDGYLLGEEGSGAFVLGLTYGEGMLQMMGGGEQKVFWQGPSVGFDYGGEGSRVMILVYHLDDLDHLWGRYGGVSGSAYLVAGVGFHVLKRRQTLLVPVRTGIGARLGVNINYLKLTSRPTWNPF